MSSTSFFGGFLDLLSCTRLFAAVVFLSISSLAFARKSDTGFLDRTLSLNNAAYKYQVFLPEDWSSNKKWPIILFLHGAGERGSDGLLQTQLGMATAVRKDRRRFAAIIGIPQMQNGLLVVRTSDGRHGTRHPRRRQQRIQGRFQAHLSHRAFDGWLW